MHTAAAFALLLASAAAQECSEDLVSLLQTQANLNVKPLMGIDEDGERLVKDVDLDPQMLLGGTMNHGLSIHTSHSMNAETQIVKRLERKDRCLIFYHVGKCGGTSIGAYFNEHGLRSWTHYRGGGPDLSRSPGFLDADVYIGHMTPGFKDVLHQLGMKRNCYEATALRNPLQRVSSLLNFWFPDNTTADYLKLLGKGPAFRAASHGPRHPGGSFEAFDDICRTFGAPSAVWDLFDHNYYKGQECSLNVAKQMLSNLDAVLFLEDFNTLIESLGKMLGVPDKSTSDWLAKRPVWNKSKNPGFENLPLELQRQIHQGNQKDLELYEWAWALKHESQRAM